MFIYILNFGFLKVYYGFVIIILAFFLVLFEEICEAGFDLIIGGKIARVGFK
jgi:hypothetical protein